MQRSTKPFQNLGHQLRLIWGALVDPHRLTCQQFLQRLDDYVDRELSEGELKRLDEHVAICHRCLDLYRHEDSFVEKMREKLGRLEAPTDFRDSLLKKLREEP